MTVHDRVKESFEPTVLQKLCVGFLRGFITSQACPRQACVLNHEWSNWGEGGQTLTFILICVCGPKGQKKEFPPNSGS